MPQLAPTLWTLLLCFSLFLLLSNTAQLWHFHYPQFHTLIANPPPRHTPYFPWQ